MRDRHAVIARMVEAADQTLPDVGVTIPQTMLISVVLLAPFAE
jgi:hypothetical protein